jgi:hypothetical protein
MHDVLWKYGFDEPSGNFQENNQVEEDREVTLYMLMPKMAVEPIMLTFQRP